MTAGQPVAALRRAMFVAVDSGAREALLPIAAHCGAALAATGAGAEREIEYWNALYRRVTPALLVVGTSDSAHGREIEAAARRAARGTDLRIAAIEDFPGNYAHVEQGAADMVIVESADAGKVLERRLGSRAPRTEIAAPARYDSYRRDAAEMRDKIAARWTAEARPSVLWAGQPETEDCLATLNALLPACATLRIELIFKAHPRDAGYRSGVYTGPLDAAGIAWSDATAEATNGTFARAPRCVVTQFSSLAIQAGFYGIPSLWALFEGAGADRLAEKKGYRTPPLCTAGGAAHVTEPRELMNALGGLLSDPGSRARLQHCFDAYFRTSAITLPDTLRALQTQINAQ